MSEVTEQITLGQIEELLESSYDLYYVDRGDSLDERMKELQDDIHDPEANNVWESVFEHWWADTDGPKADLLKKMTDKWDIDHDEAEELYDDHDIRSCIEDRDTSTPIADLLRNTSAQAMYYSTGIYLHDMYESLDDRLDTLKKKLRIEEDDQDDTLRMMLAQASYGGEVVIYFCDELGPWINPGENVDLMGNLITFDGCYIAVIHTGNGSGDHCWFSGKISLQFRRDHVFICKAVHYSYTHEVCGMFNSWCEDTKYRIDEEILVHALGDDLLY